MPNIPGIQIVGAPDFKFRRGQPTDPEALEARKKKRAKKQSLAKRVAKETFG